MREMLDRDPRVTEDRSSLGVRMDQCCLFLNGTALPLAHSERVLISFPHTNDTFCFSFSRGSCDGDVVLFVPLC